MKPTVVITETLDPTCAQWLEQFAQVVWCSHEQGDALARCLADAQGLVVRTYTQVDDDLLDLAPRLKVVGRAGVGLDNVDVATCRKRGVEVVYTPDANTQAVVEYVLGLMLDACRPRYTLVEPVEPAAFHELRRTQVGTQLDSMTLGIVGLGRIGKRLATVAHAIGMNLMVNDLLPEPRLRRNSAEPWDYASKDDLYRGADVVTIHVDGRPENRHLINAAALAQLKPSCLLINAARGMLVDAHALADWARRVEPHGGRAVLDVHDPEPPPATYPLHGLPNVRLLPHLASRTDIALENMSWVVRDVWAVLDGTPPTYPAP